MLLQEERKILKKALEEAAGCLDHKQISKQNTAENIEKKYSKAYRFYQIGEYRKAKKLFLQLVMLQPFQKKFWIGLAACRQLEKSYNEALVAWSMVALLDDKDPWPHFYAAECYLMLDKKEEGLKAFHASMDRTKEKDSMDPKIKKLQESLENGQ